MIENTTLDFRMSLRSAGHRAMPHLVGYAAVFGKTSHPLSSGSIVFRERILPGAFRDVLNGKGEVLALVSHDPTLILGRRSTGTLKLHEDRNGLWVDIDPPNTSVGRDTVEQVRSGNINGMSAAFRVSEDEWDAMRPGHVQLRTIKRFSDLRDVSVTPQPAYPDTSVGIGGGSHRSCDFTPSRDRLRFLLRLAESV